MSNAMETVAIIGAGALGAVYGGMLCDCSPGSACVIADGRRYESLKRQGITVNGRPYAVPVVRRAEARPADLVIVAVKHYHLDQAIIDMKHTVGEDTTILSVMNGIDSEERIGAVYGMDKVVYGLTLGIDAVREGNTVTFRNLGRILFGEEKNDVLSDRVSQISEFFTRVGIIHEIPQDMIRSLWFKYMINVGANQVSAVLGANYGMLRSSEDARLMMESAMAEVIAIARAMKINLTEKDIVEWYKVLASLNETGKTSMLQDVEAGRETEVEMLAGTLIELGKRLGIPTPENQKLFDELKRIESGVRDNHPHTLNQSQLLRSLI